MKGILEVLDELYQQVHTEFTRQDNRAARRLAQDRDIAAADGQCTGLEKAMNFIATKRREIDQESQKDTATYVVQNTPILENTLRYAKVMELLKAGKKVKVNRNYTGLQIPMLTLNYSGGRKVSLDLSCCESHNFETYPVDSAGEVLESISVTGYGLTSRCNRIEYIFANGQMNRLFAHLEDGRDVDYDLCILDMWGTDGEYQPEPTQSVTIEFMPYTISTTSGNYGLAMKSEVAQFPQSLSHEEILTKITKEYCFKVDHYAKYTETDLLVTFEDGLKSIVPYTVLNTARSNMDNGII